MNSMKMFFKDIFSNHNRIKVEIQICESKTTHLKITHGKEEEGWEQGREEG